MGMTIVIVVLLIGTVNSLRKETPFQVATNKFNEKEFSSMPENERQVFIDVITKHTGWHLADEFAEFGETKNHFFPFTANYQVQFVNPNEPAENIFYTRLFIYDPNLESWLPITVTNSYIKSGDNQTLKNKTSTVWEGRDDWFSIFSQYQPKPKL